MNLAPRQSQRQKLAFRQIEAIGLLSLGNAALCDDLAQRAAKNPALRLRLPRTQAAPSGGEQAAIPGLYDHILPQIRLILQSATDLPFALACVEALDGNGWLGQPLSEIAFACGISQPEAEMVLRRLQTGIEPSGLFACDLAECLRLQAIDQGDYNPDMERILSHLAEIATGEAALALASGLPLPEVRRQLSRLRRYSPRPAMAFGGDNVPIREPDLIVTHVQGQWQVALNRSTLPTLSVDADTNAPAVLRGARSEAEWLANVLERRNRTLLLVARAILRRQHRYLMLGPAGLVALSRSDIAAGIGLHPSTVGRIASALLIETPHGMTALSSLFGCTAQAHPTDTNAPSAAAIRHRLAQLIAAENPRTPFTDVALCAILAREGKDIARRTVSKFREEIGAPAFAIRRQRAETLRDY